MVKEDNLEMKLIKCEKYVYENTVISCEGKQEVNSEQQEKS